MSASIIKNSLIDLALLVAPELAAAPFYLLMEPPAGYPVAENYRAFTTLSTDPLIRAALIEQGEWRGPGVVIVLHTEADDMESLAGIFIHEVAHNVPARTWPADREPSAEECSHHAELIALLAEKPESEFTILPPWHQHGLPFIRACLHLRERAKQAGLTLPWPAINFAGGNYKLSGAWRYAKCLGNEPARMLGATFSEIEATEPPEEFTALFEADKAAWERSNPRGIDDGKKIYPSR